MGLTVKERGRHVATFRFVEVRLMEILSGWVPSTPEMEAKLLLGPHIWDTAQAADALGKRTYELRLPLQHSLAPAAPYLNVLETLAAVDTAPRRIAAFYDALLPGLMSRYRGYLERTDALMDAPTVRIMERILDTDARMIREANALRAELPALRCDDPDWLDGMVALESAVAELAAADPSSEGTRQAA